MPLPTRPRYAPGSHPGKGFMDDIRGMGLRLAIITRVDEVNLKADLKMLTGGGERFETDLTQAMAGPRSFWGGVPEENSLVVLGFRPKHKQVDEAVILGYLPVGNKSGLRFDPFAPSDPTTIAPDEAELYAKIIGSTVRHKRLRLRPGNVGGMSAQGAELVLDRDIRMVNRAGDLLELRDAERTLLMQAIHRVDSASGVKSQAGPVRRLDLYLPDDVLQADGRTLKTEAQRYYGRDELQALGPGLAGSAYKYSNASGVINEFLNDETRYPSVTLANGRKVYYPTTVAGTALEDGEEGPGDAFTEHRVELTHQTDLSQDVLAEIDGFPTQSRRPFIQHVLGTVVGNDPFTAQGLRQYGKVLRPQLWTDFTSTKQGKFTLEEVDRGGSDAEANTAAAAYLLRIDCPTTTTEDNPFAVAVQKQGKVLINVPRPNVERYPDARGVSVEANILGALKLFLGAAGPTNTSLQATLAGGIRADIGHNSDTGNALDVTFHSGVRQVFRGAPNDTNDAVSTEIQGNSTTSCSGDLKETVEGTRSLRATNLLDMGADRVNINATSGFAATTKDTNWVIAGQSQYRYAQLVQETIATGGRLSTILVGSETRNILAGALTTNVAAGATVFNNPGGAFAVNVGAGAITLTSASGAVAITAGAGAVAVTAGLAMTLTAGLAMNLTASAAISLLAPQVLLGGPAAILGLVRGIPALPPGAPSLDYILGIPYLGSALMRSILCPSHPPRCSCPFQAT